jgi:hypothetical protein
VRKIILACLILTIASVCPGSILASLGQAMQDLGFRLGVD